MYFDYFRLWSYLGGATAAAAANTEIDCNSKTTDRRTKRMKIWALWAVVVTYHHIYFDRLKHRFHRGCATVGTVVTTEIDHNSETAARRAKWTQIWALWGIVDTCQDIYFDLLKHRFPCGGATAAAAANTEIACKSKTAARRAKRTKIWSLW